MQNSIHPRANQCNSVQPVLPSLWDASGACRRQSVRGHVRPALLRARASSRAALVGIADNRTLPPGPPLLPRRPGVDVDHLEAFLEGPAFEEVTAVV
jgi:hypothetical protein